MENITNNHMHFLLKILKSPEEEYNANSIAKKMGISSMGALKIAKSLEKEGILITKQMGRAKFYKINLENDYAKQYVKFLLRREAELSSPSIKRWISEIKKIKNASLAILFGSVLRNEREAKDIDVLLIANNKSFKMLKKEIKEINLINTKQLHPIYQVEEDIKNNIKKGDKVVLNAIKGIVVFGEDMLISMLEK